MTLPTIATRTLRNSLPRSTFQPAAHAHRRSPRLPHTPLRPFTATAPPRLARSELQIASNSDGADVLRDATTLVDAGRWHLCKDGAGLERPFTFGTFAATWAFMNDVAAECKRQRHHPEWANVFTRTEIRWTTHRPRGLSSKDTVMARFCDEAAARHGEVGS
ncbi:hypothetical protein LTR53_005164 [Teratosphaeriaceae sp. CCFEE 6253]|nr:hypothetical protein LTR53_005164 [Teratosphaeriaceae sp. CCFEE 6253]